MSLQADIQLALPGFQLDAHFSLPAQGVSVLFGPSGAGKSTLLRCLAGLEQGVRGRLQFGTQCWLDSAQGRCLPAHQRSIGMVFQDARLFPHLDVRANLAFGYQRTPAAARRLAWDQIVDLLDLGPLLARRSSTLSGGERQRVAIGRALLTSPELLLLDEPLAALDLVRKQEILPLLSRLQQELTLPLVYITHALDEVSRLADHLLLLAEGKLLAQGGLSEVLSRTDLPAWLDEELGVVLETELQEELAEYQLLRLGFAGGQLLVPAGSPTSTRRRRVRILARDVSLALQADAAVSILNRLPAVVQAIRPANHPAHVLVQLTLGASQLLARITRYSCATLQLQPGMPVWAQIKSVALL
ncbi:molybdenum ABC transporter ATP-binding protein [Chitinimonas taiwanensis]|uniref:Molybdate transport system ATP-binding protein n=1 Tax=Chitinimonas taiwanensis DSM 18899 TaxID=1121279 RepID=A0A1K2H3H7_9NEIS|nr:molybdenum ABC transporter ATP-binding protein [Chitinimonas taiwanensis]SFZ70090.1 molybdate transport system ATP-binding protein [Chitinimonas taiwanensis DSM 18899]